MDVECFVSLNPSYQRWNIYNAITGGGSGGIPIVVDPYPVTLTDFSMFPGGVIPTSGTYFAFDADWVYSLDIPSGDTTWQQSARSN